MELEDGIMVETWEYTDSQKTISVSKDMIFFIVTQFFCGKKYVNVRTTIKLKMCQKHKPFENY